MPNNSLVSQIERVAKSSDDTGSGDFNSAMADLQDLLGQDDGGVAGAFFSGADDEWRQMSFEERVDLLVRYVKTEIDHLIADL